VIDDDVRNDVSDGAGTVGKSVAFAVVIPDRDVVNDKVDEEKKGYSKVREEDKSETDAGEVEIENSSDVADADIMIRKT
jgi:hypothetical protein